jgi:aryl-alcohol dehydrogenase-like predicted oxidoreductase
LLAGKRRGKTARAATDTYGHDLYGKEISAADARVVETLEEVAADAGIPPARMALAWLLQKPGVVAPIVGVSKPGQLEDAIGAVAVSSLTPDILSRLEAPYIPHLTAGM